MTPEATLKVATRLVPGISEAIRYESMKYTNRAMLSRGVSVIRNNTLIINLPGSVKAVKESLDIIIDPLHHGLEILKEMHTIVQVMIDYSPIWISFKCAAFSIFITFF